jgi:hypothetical protein
MIARGAARSAHDTPRWLSTRSKGYTTLAGDETCRMSMPELLTVLTMVDVWASSLTVFHIRP